MMRLEVRQATKQPPVDPGCRQRDVALKDMMDQKTIVHIRQHGVNRIVACVKIALAAPCFGKGSEPLESFPGMFHVMKLTPIGLDRFVPGPSSRRNAPGGKPRGIGPWCRHRPAYHKFRQTFEMGHFA